MPAHHDSPHHRSILSNQNAHKLILLVIPVKLDAQIQSLNSLNQS